MDRRRRPRLVYLLGSLLALGAFLHAPPAYSAPGDPSAGSPSGAVYQLPLQQGRADGAPKSGGGGGGESGQGGSEGGSLYRTENDFGSASRVPGAPGSGGGGPGGGGAAGTGGSGAATAAGGAAGGGSGAGALGAAGAGVAAGGAAAASQVADTGNTSLGDSIALLAAIGLAATAIGVGSRRLSQRRRAVG
jgi:hypothetical protein